MLKIITQKLQRFDRNLPIWNGEVERQSIDCVTHDRLILLQRDSARLLLASTIIMCQSKA
jgi:hypothetical protein